MLAGVPHPTPANAGRRRKRRRTCTQRKRSHAMQQRLQTLMVPFCHNKSDACPKITAWLESDWFHRVCNFVGATGAYTLCRLARASKSCIRSMWLADVASMRRLGLASAQGGEALPYLPWFSVDGHKRRYIAQTQTHPVPNVFRISAPSRMCRVCFGARSACTQIRLHVGPRYCKAKSTDRSTGVPVCEQCVMADRAPTWQSVQLYGYMANRVPARLLNVPAPAKTRRTSCGLPTVLMGPLVHHHVTGGGTRDPQQAEAEFVRVSKVLQDNLLQLQALGGMLDQEDVRKALMDTAVQCGGLDAGTRGWMR